mgnify:CR=1 FL=1
MLNGTNPLSEREREILILVATGATNQQIAKRLCISVNTVKVHMRNIFSKVGAESRTEATMWAVHQGLVRVSVAQPPGVTADSLQPVAELADVGASVETGPGAVTALPLPSWKKGFLLLWAFSVLLVVLLPSLLHSSAPQEDASVNAFNDRATFRSNGVASRSSRWSSRAGMPSPRARLAVAAVGNLVYAIGGDMGGTASDVVEAYDPLRNNWQVGAAKPTAVSNVGASVADGLIFVPGGMMSDGTVTDVLEVYDVKRDVWTSRSPVPIPVCAYALSSAGKNIYLFGGWDGHDYLSSVYIYDTDADVWSQGAPMSTPRAFVGAGSVKEKIYVIGGYDGKQEFALCEEYDPLLEGAGQSPWRERAPMNLPRGGLAVASVGDMLFVVGGGWQNYLAYNERYDPLSNVWSSFETPIVGQWRNLGLAAVDVSLYALGGWNGEYLNANEEYQALYRVILPIRGR